MSRFRNAGKSCCEIWNAGRFLLVESGIVAFGIGIQLKKSGIPQTIGIWIQVPQTRNSESIVENLESKTVLDYMVLHGAKCWAPYNSKTFILKRSMVSSQLYPQFLVSRWASSRARSGSGAGKGRRTCNYLSGIWTTASKKSMQNADWRRWHY